MLMISAFVRCSGAYGSIHGLIVTLHAEKRGKMPVSEQIILILSQGKL